MGCSDKTSCVLGLGYIGLPTAALLASKNFQVSGIDLDKNTVNTVNAGEIHNRAKFRKVSAIRR